MTITVSPDKTRNTHHIKLSKAGDEIGLITCRSDGSADEHGTIQVESYPRSAIQMVQGRGKHEDQNLPFSEIQVLADASGGRGQRDTEDNATRYADSTGVFTPRAGMITLGPLPLYAKGHRTQVQHQPEGVYFQPLYGASRYVATGLAANMNADKAELILRKAGTPNSFVTCAVYTEVAGDPGVMVCAGNYAVASADAVLSQRVIFDWAGVAALAGNYFILVVADSALDDATDHWEVGIDLGNFGKSSADGMTWGNFFSLYYRLLDADADFKATFFTYKGLHWAIRTPDAGGNSSLWLLTSATQTWTSVIADLGGVVTDHVIGGDFVYFARGDGARVSRFYDDGTGTICTNTAEPYVYADKLTCIGNILWGWVADALTYFSPGFYQYPSALWRAEIPAQAGPLWWNRGEIADTESLWNARECPQAELESGYTAAQIGAVGLPFDFVMVKDLAAPVDIAGGERVCFEFYNSGGLTAGVLRLSDEPNLGGTPSKVVHTEAANVIMENSRDNDLATFQAFTLTNTGFLYILPVSNKRVSRVYFTLGAQKNNNASVLSCEVYDVTTSAWIAATVASDGTAVPALPDPNSATMAQSGWVDITMPENAGLVTPTGLTEGRWIRFKVNNNLDAVDLCEVILELEDYINVTLTGAATGWTWQALAIDPSTVKTVQSVGLVITTNAVAARLYALRGGICLGVEAEYFPAPDNITVNAIVPLPDELSGLESTPYLFSDRGIYRVVDGLIIPLPQDELAAISTDMLGAAWCRNNTYVYFSCGERKLLRMAGRLIEDIGPDLGEGLPGSRAGEITALLSLPGGKVAAAVNGNTYASVLLYSGGGYHELFRSPHSGDEIRGLHYEELGAYDGTGRIWINCGSDFVYIPYNDDPELLSPVIWEGYITSGRIHFGRYDQEKFWHTLKVVSENLSAQYGREVLAQYRITSANTWTTIGTFDTSTYQEMAIAAAQNVESRWIEFRLILRTESDLLGPEINALVVEALTRVPERSALSFTFRLADQDKTLLPNIFEGLTAKTKYDQLVEWMGEPGPVLLNTDDSLYDGVYVFLQRTGLRRVKRFWEGDKQKEVWIYRLAALMIDG